jgi:hypothetical protein
MSIISPTVSESTQEIGTLNGKLDKDSIWGDDIDLNNNKSKSLLCVFENINGFGYEADSPKAGKIRELVNRHNIDCYMMAELNTNWRIAEKKRSFEQSTKHWFEKQRSNKSYNHYDRSGDKSLPGGTGIISVGDLALRRFQCGEDSKHLGRWSWQRFQGKQGSTLRIVSVYFPSLNNAFGHKKVHCQQKKALLSLGDKSSVFSAFWRDFWKAVDTWLEEGDELVIGGDWNIDVTRPAFLRPFHQRGLIAAITSSHSAPFASTHSRGTRPIDEIFTTPGIDITACGYMEFGTGVGDHRPIWILITMASALGANLPSLPSYQARRLKCHDPIIVERYLRTLSEFLDQHQVIQRLKALYESYESPLTAEQTCLYEELDSLRVMGMNLAEKKCRKLNMGGKQWSPQLQHARWTIEYIKLCLSKTRGAKVNARPLLRLSKKTHLQYQYKSSRDLIILLDKAHVYYKSIKTEHIQMRQTFLEGLADRLEAAGQGKKATILRQLLETEAQRDMFRQLKYIRAKSNNLATTQVSVTNIDGSTSTFTKQEEMVAAIATANKKKYHQTENSCPFLHPPLKNMLGVVADGPKVANVLDGSFIPPPGTDTDTSDFLAACKQSHHRTSLPRSVHHFKQAWKSRKETTASGKLHFGHFKAGLAEEFISLAHFIFAEIPFRSGYSPRRWQKATQVMILKKAGIWDVNKLRTIVLFEADYNHNNGHLARSMMHHAVDHHLLAHEQYSIPGKKCIDQVLNRVLLFDITRYQKSTLAITSCDLASCYDRICHTPATLAMASLGLPLEPIQSMFSTFQSCQFYTRTAYGDSTSSWGGQEANYIASPQGTGQGNQCGPAAWAAVSSKMFQVLHNANLASQIIGPITNETVSLCGFAFVDDTDLIATCNSANSVTETMKKMQQVVTKWCGVTKATGGVVETSPNKSWWYLIDFNWTDGQFAYAPPDPNLSLLATNSTNTIVPLTQMNVHAAQEMLGVFVAPSGNSTQQLKKMMAISLNFSEIYRKSNISRYQAWIALTMISLKSIEYPLPSTSFDSPTCTSIVWPLLKTLLSKAGINKHIPRAVLYGPSGSGGLGLNNIFWLQGVLHIVDIIDHLWSKSVSGHLLQTSLQELRSELGTNTDFFSQHFQSYNNLIMTDSWILNTWKFTSKFHIHLTNLSPPVKWRRQNDQSITDAIRNNPAISPSEWRSINRCRLYLKVFTLSDITTADGLRLTGYSIRGYRHLPSTNPSIHFQHWQQPPQYCWTQWRKALRLTFCINKKYSYHHQYQLASPLGPWLENNSSLWEWYLNSDRNLLFRYHTQQWFIHRPLTFHREPTQFQEKGTLLPIHQTPHIASLLRTTTERRIGYYDSHRSAPMSAPTESIPVTHLEIPPWILFKEVHSPTTAKLFWDLHHNTAQMVTDGSYKDSDGTAAWIIESQDGTEFIMGLSLVPGPSTIQNAYRSELTGILAILLKLQNIIKQWNFDSIGGTIGCDNMAALFRGTDVSSNLSCKTKHADLLASCKRILNHNDIKLCPIHIYGHQDDLVNYDSLPPLAQMNIRMDHFAKQARILYSTEIAMLRNYTPLPSSFHLPRVDNIPIYDQVKENLYHHIAHQNLVTYWIHQHKFTTDQQSVIHWRALHRARTTSKHSYRQFMSKWNCNFLGTGKNMKRWKLRHESNCPYCYAPNEDILHVFKCQHTSAQAEWKRHLFSWALSLRAHKVSEPLIIAIKRDLYAWKHGAQFPPITYLSDIEQAAILHQRSISWRSFLEGFISIQWEQVLQHSYDQQKLKRSVILGLSKLIKSNWKFCAELWQSRNSQLHNTQCIQDLSGRKILLASISSELGVGLSCLPANEFSGYFNKSIRNKLRFDKHTSLQFKKDWFATIRSARILYRDINIVQDSFTTSQALCDWVGLIWEPD